MLGQICICVGCSVKQFSYLNSLAGIIVLWSLFTVLYAKLIIAQYTVFGASECSLSSITSIGAVGMVGHSPGFNYHVPTGDHDVKKNVTTFEYLISLTNRESLLSLSLFLLLVNAILCCFLLELMLTSLLQLATMLSATCQILCLRIYF